MTRKEDTISYLLKQLSQQDFLNVGLHQVAYIRHVSLKNPRDGGFAVYAADGSQLSVMDSYERAVAAIRINDLHPVTLH